MPHDKGREKFYNKTPEKNYIQGKAPEVDQFSQNGRAIYHEFSIAPVTQHNSPRK